jgi:hypothetical protein
MEDAEPRRRRPAEAADGSPGSPSDNPGVRGQQYDHEHGHGPEPDPVLAFAIISAVLFGMVGVLYVMFTT